MANKRLLKLNLVKHITLGLFITGCILLNSIFQVPYTKIVNAQREQSDFEFQYEKYRETYTVFKTARDEFLKSSTLISQNEAVLNTQILLAQRAQVLRTYFYALKYQLNANSGVAVSEKTRLSAKLDNEIGWLQGHMDDLSGIKNPTLSQLFEISDRFERKEDEYRSLGYESLSIHLIGKVYALNQEFVAINGELKPYIEKVQGTYLNNWLAEANNNSYQAMQHVKAAEDLLPELRDGSSNKDNVVRTYSKIQTEVTGAQQLLTKGVGYQKEIIKDLEVKLPRATPLATASTLASPSADNK